MSAARKFPPPWRVEQTDGGAYAWSTPTASGSPTIQALDRTQPGLPLKKGRAGTMTHDYKRNGTTTPVRRLGKVIGRCKQRHRHQEFIRFLNAVEREVPAGKTSAPSSTTTPLTSTPR